ncbi:MAG: T9SS type A sorting domain-containing protein [Bacteroidota bacterium]
MKVLYRLHFLWITFIFPFTLSAQQQTFTCSDINGVYFVTVLNPNATDASDGTIDGSCEYSIGVNVFAFTTTPITFTYVGDNVASPTSVVYMGAGGTPAMTITSPCGNLEVDFDVTDGMANNICPIRNVFMPVELTKFEARAIKSGIQLYWQTASELNNLGFEIERSSDGKAWKKIAFIEGHLTTLEAQSYQFLDENPLQDFAYYRLKQMDTDGQFEYSSIVAVKSKNEAKEIKIFPNPTGDELYINLPEEARYRDCELFIFDYLGKLVLCEKSNNNRLDVSSLQKGVYSLSIKTTRQTHHTSFIKK